MFGNKPLVANKETGADFSGLPLGAVLDCWLFRSRQF
jgi:hypothetical protein